MKALLFSVLFLPLKQGCANAEHGTSLTGSSAASATVSDTSNQHTKFGIMIAKSEGQQIPPERQVKIARDLGVHYIRARIDIQGWDGSEPSYNAYASAGFKVLLNVNYGVPRNAAGEHAPVPFPTDMNAYSKTLNSVLDKYKPEVVVIENEEDNPNYHQGSADDYINELKTGIQVAHSKGLKVTNGGITVREICLIIYDDLVQSGQKDKAMEFARKAFPQNFANRLGNGGDLTRNPQIGRQVEFGRKIIAAYKNLDLDYVNFHWYEPVQARGKNIDKSSVSFDPATFEYVVNYLREKTGKPVMTNEFGVLEPSADLVRNLLKAARDANLSYAIFYSADGGEGKAVALQNASGDLRENGHAFKDFVKDADGDSK
jgi:hypothetical protein